MEGRRVPDGDVRAAAAHSSPPPGSEGPADPARAGSHAAAGIGERVKVYRTRRGVKVSELARSVGVSPSLISQIERAQSRPSVATLFSLAKALDVSIDAFFTDELRSAGDARPTGPADAAPHGVEPGSDEPPLPRAGAMKLGVEWPEGGARHRHMIRKDQRATLDIEGGIRWERLTPTSLDELEFLEIIYAPGAESNPVPYTHGGREVVLLLEGALEVYVAFDRYRLDPGDSIMFPSSLPHRYVNPRDSIARGISVILKDDLLRERHRDEGWNSATGTPPAN